MRRALKAALEAGPAGRRPQPRPSRARGFTPAEEGRPGGHGEVACRQAQVDHQPRADDRRQAVAREDRRDQAGDPAVPRRSSARAADRRGAPRPAASSASPAAMNSGTGLNLLQKAEPDHYFDVGIAEQQAVLFAAGLAPAGQQARVRDLLHLPAARVRPDRPRRLPPGARRPRSRSTAPAWSATTARRTTASSTSPTCGRCRTSRSPRPRDEAPAQAPAAHRADPGAGRSACANPRGEGRRRGAALDPRGSSRSPSARASCCGRARGSRWSATATGVGKALEAADLLAEARPSRSRSPTRASPSRWTSS